jgi:hypothetical protein
MGRAIAAAVTILAVASPGHGQATGVVDVGMSSVHYDGYLASGAAYLNPTFRFEAPNVAFAAKGSGVVFESGSHILQGTVAGAWRSRQVGQWRAEVSGSGGVTSYTTTDDRDYPVYGHVLARLRTHYAARRSGAWVGAAVGQSFFGDAAEVPVEVGAGAWVAGARVAASGTIRQTWLGDISYIDVSASVRWVHQRFDFAGTAGVRTASAGGGSGTWAEGSLRVPIAGPVAALIGGGQYPSDPVRGLLAATFVTAGVSVTAFGGRATPRLPVPDRRPDVQPAGPRLAVEELVGGSVAIVITAPGATSVELAGDFTDWQAVTLEPASGGTWVLQTALAPGVYRVNVRIDGGAWTVPVGHASLEDDFGGVVALLVVS